MQIGNAAQMSGIPAKTIRYYEEVGLIQPAHRTESGYRTYDESDVATLRFIQRARGLGFSVTEARLLLGLWADRARSSADVKGMALDHIGEIDRKIAELQSMRDTLVDLTERCHGDDRPDCPILDDLAR